MRTIYTTNEDIKTLRGLGVQTVNAIQALLTACGHAPEVEKRLMDAYHLGYQAGAKAEAEGKHREDRKSGIVVVES